MARRKKAIYVAIIGDVVASRRVPNRAALQRRLGVALAEVNRRFAPAIASTFALTIGDEFQGLLGGADDLHRLLGRLRAAVHPIEVRFGLGVGRLDTPLMAEAIGMDGPCFHRARTALARAAEIASPVEVEAGSYAAAFRIYGSLHGALRRRWTERQRQVFDLSMSGLSGKEIARQLSIEPSAVSQHLRASQGASMFTATEYWLDSLRDALSQKETG